jgi:hypothetical protein
MDPAPTQTATPRDSPTSARIARSSMRTHKRKPKAGIAMSRYAQRQRNQLLRLRRSTWPYHTLITTSFCTFDTPGADHAAVSACSFSSQDRTVPRKITLLSTASTLI